MKKFVTCVSLGLALSLGIVGLSPLPAVASGGNGGAQSEVRISARLSGAVFNGVRPEGNAEARVKGTQRQFKAEAEHVNLPDGAALMVQVNGVTVGMIRLVTGHGELELNSNNGNAVPAVQKGAMVTILTVDGAPILSGTF